VTISVNAQLTPAGRPAVLEALRCAEAIAVYAALADRDGL